MREKIINKLKEVRVHKAISPEDRELKSMISYILYVLNSGMKLQGSQREFLISHPKYVLVDDSQYRVTRINNLKFEVYYRNNPIARFFKLERSIEYVLLLIEII